MRNQISFHSIESNRWYAGGRWKRDESRPDSEVRFGHPTLSEPLCGWDWYKSHYDRPYEDSTLEISFDDKKLAKIESWGYKKGMITAIIELEIAKHPNDYYKFKRKWNWLYDHTKIYPPTLFFNEAEFKSEVKQPELVSV